METSLTTTTGNTKQGGVLDKATWQIHWRRISAQSASWYSTPPGKVGRQFTAVLDAEWRGVLDRKWNSERPLVFSHVVLTKTQSARKAREILARINFQLDLCERGIHTGLVRGCVGGGKISRETRRETQRRGGGSSGAQLSHHPAVRKSATGGLLGHQP